MLVEGQCPLRELALGGQALGHAGVTALAESLHLHPSLESLDLKAAELAPRTVSRLCLWGLDHGSLQWLDLRLNSVTANTRQFVRDRIAQVALAAGEERARSEIGGAGALLKGTGKGIYTGPYEPAEGSEMGMVPAWQHGERQPWDSLYATMY